MKIIDIEIAMMKQMGVRKNIIVPNVSWGIQGKDFKPLHECDLLSLSLSGYATEIEIKTSKADLLKDKEKEHKHKHDHILIKNLYFAVPDSLKEIALKEIPESAGLYVLTKNKRGKIKVEKAKEAVARRDALKWDDKQQKKLMHLGVMRLLSLKEKINKKG